MVIAERDLGGAGQIGTPGVDESTGTLPGLADWRAERAAMWRVLVNSRDALARAAAAMAGVSVQLAAEHRDLSTLGIELSERLAGVGRTLQKASSVVQPDVESCSPPKASRIFHRGEADGEPG